MLGIPPVYLMPNRSLRDTSGRIIVQQFFMGIRMPDSIWRISKQFQQRQLENNPSAEWVSVASIKGVPVVIYANRPLDETKGLDAKAQADLDDYLYDKDLAPTVVIHRGHSYWLPSTIDQLPHLQKLFY